MQNDLRVVIGGTDWMLQHQVFLFFLLFFLFFVFVLPKGAWVVVVAVVVVA